MKGGLSKFMYLRCTVSKHDHLPQAISLILLSCRYVHNLGVICAATNT